MYNLLLIFIWMWIKESNKDWDITLSTHLSFEQQLLFRQPYVISHQFAFVWISNFRRLMRNIRSDSYHTSASLRSRRANAEVMTYRPPARSPLPLAFRRTPRSDIQLLRMKNIQRFIQLFIFYMILTNGYCRTFRVLLCGIFGTILYYLHGSFKRN